MEVSYSPDQDQVRIKPHKAQPSMRSGAEWQRTPSPRVHRNTSPSSVLENGSDSRSGPPESYFSQLDFLQQGCMNRDLHEEEQKLPEPRTESDPTLSPSPAQSLEADPELPLETDIDDFQEEELPGEDTPLTSELPCFAQPVKVLETDMDLVPDPGASPCGEAPAESSSADELETEESWRGASQPVESNTSSLDRYRVRCLF